MDEERWVVVHVAAGMINASIILGKLQTDGIPAKLGYESVGRIYALTVDGLGEVRILVPQDYREQALDVISDIYEDGEIAYDE